MAATIMTGLDISTSCVRAAQLSIHKGEFSLDRFGQMPLPQGAVEAGEVRDPAAVGQAIKVLWKQAKFKKRDVSIGIANQRVVVRQVEIAHVPKDERRKSLPLLVGDQIPMPVDQAVLDFVPLEQGVGTDNAPIVKGLLVAAAEDSILAAVAAAEAGGLTVRDVDLTPFALVRALVSADPLGVRQDAEALIDVGASTTTVVVHVNGLPQFVRILLMGGQDVTDRFMGDLGVDLPTAESLKRETGLGSDQGAEPGTPGALMSEVTLRLVDELRGSLDYYLATSTLSHLDRIVVTGGGSLVHGFAHRLEEATGLPVVRGAALSALGPGHSGLSPEHLMFADPLASAAVGLAVRAA